MDISNNYAVYDFYFVFVILLYTPTVLGNDFGTRGLRTTKRGIHPNRLE